jgi:hypothetical protein
MTLRSFFVGRTIVFTVLAMLAALYVAFYAFNAYIYNAKQSDGTEIQSYRGTLEGEYVCLGDGTLGPAECEKGLLLDDGSLYAIDLALLSQQAPALIVGNRLVASGVITPIELLSTDHWQQYGVTGIFSVTDSLEVL